ncbi:MAG: hypothetical protein AAF572_16820 [Cyanobacteria bacterium P01_B01_bin.77]
MAASGAYRINQQFALGLTDEWYIEEQRFGADALISGLLHNDSSAIEAGLKMFDWGFVQQQQDGSFGNTGDAFHSTSLFIQSVAYALLTLQESPVADQYTDVIEQYLTPLNNAAHWMIQADIWEQGLTHTAPYTHRYYILSAALGLTGKLTNDQKLIDYADQTIIAGLARQQSDGANPEMGGHDTSYQMSGALYAMRWLTHFSTDPLAADVATMLDQALLWEDSVILETGAINSDGNTRTEGVALTRAGEIKQINHREIIYGFAYWFSMTDESLWESNALQVASYYYSEDEQVVLALEKIEHSQSPLIDVEPTSKSQPVPETSYSFGLLMSGVLCFLCRCKSLQS